MDTTDCRQLPNEPQLYSMPAGLRNVINATIQPQTTYGMHDFTQYTDYGDEGISLENLLEEDCKSLEPEIDAFMPPNMVSYGTFISDLNADAKLFFPPYLRYRKYRVLAQQQELEEYKEKVAKIAALSKGTELITTEVLEKLQHAQTQIENEDKKDTKPNVTIEVKEENDDTQKITQQRKRKISAIKQEPKASDDVITDSNNIIKEEVIQDSTDKIDSKVKPFAYKYADYKKFLNQPNNKDHKQKQQPKMKFKKYKK